MKVRFMILGMVIMFSVAAQEKKPNPKDAPKLLYPVPLTLIVGQKEKLIVRGLQMESATDWKCNHTAISVKLIGKPRASKGPNNYPSERCGDWECELEVEIPKSFSGSELELTASGAKGVSQSLKVPIINKPRQVEKEPNDGFSQAQELKIPMELDGSIGRERDVDVFRFQGLAQQQILIEIHAARWGSPMDGLLTVYDSEKRILATCDDMNGVADPKLQLTLPRDGVYFVSVLDAHDAGGAMFPYRISVTVPK